MNVTFNRALVAALVVAALAAFSVRLFGAQQTVEWIEYLGSKALEKEGQP